MIKHEYSSQCKPQAASGRDNEAISPRADIISNVRSAELCLYSLYKSQRPRELYYLTVWRAASFKTLHEWGKKNPWIQDNKNISDIKSIFDINITGYSRWWNWWHQLLYLLLFHKYKHINMTFLFQVETEKGLHYQMFRDEWKPERSLHSVCDLQITEPEDSSSHVGWDVSTSFSPSPSRTGASETYLQSINTKAVTNFNLFYVYWRIMFKGSQYRRNTLCINNRVHIKCANMF